MKKFCYKGWVKALAGILCILTFNTTLLSLAGILYAEDLNLYDSKWEDIKENSYSQILSNYSIKAVSDYEDDFGMEELQNTNFRYGVIQTDSLEGLDLNDKSQYLVCNFDKEVSLDMLHVYSCNMGENTNFSVGSTIFDTFYLYNSSYNVVEKWYPIEACYYDRNSRQIYALANQRLYQIPDSYISILQYDADNVGYGAAQTSSINGETAETPESNVTEEMPEWKEKAIDVERTDQTTATIESIEMSERAVSCDLNQFIRKNKKENGYEWKNDNISVLIGDYSYFLSDIRIVTSAELQTIGEVEEEWNTEYGYYGEGFSGYGIYTVEEMYVDTLPYFIVSYVNEPLRMADMEDNEVLWADVHAGFQIFAKQDMFCQMLWVLNLLYSYRIGMYVVCMVSILIFFAALLVFTIGTGHKKGAEEIQADEIDKIPFDVLTVLTGVIAAVCIAFVGVLAEERHYRLLLSFGILVMLAAEVILLLYYDSFISRLKIGKWWNNTICCRLWNFCIRSVKNICLQIAGALPLLWKAILLMIVLAVLELMGLFATMYDPEATIVLWVIEKIVVYGGLLLYILQMVRLQKAAELLANGAVEQPIDTEKMFLELKVHGNNLNRIREGIGSAVEKQMKSERFKTELITNVSHDIKTPLTSIINYVDLLEKENIENPKAKEYLEVLSRQSVRLKKLIENLIEASKASTGNLTVCKENCNVCVMLTQTIGEFEEKLKAGEIELQVKGNTIEAWIQADPRHLWRVFENLMNNICKYAQPHTRAYVNMERGDAEVKIIFRNISQYALNIDSETLMERFVRGDSSRNTEGNGLGLSIAQSLTELMQGKFELVVDGDLFKVILSFPLIEKPILEDEENE